MFKHSALPVGKNQQTGRFICWKFFQQEERTPGNNCYTVEAETRISSKFCVLVALPRIELGSMV